MISLYSPFTVVGLKNMKQRDRRNNTVKKTITINFGYFILKRCGYNYPSQQPYMASRWRRADERLGMGLALRCVALRCVLLLYCTTHTQKKNRPEYFGCKT